MKKVKFKKPSKLFLIALVTVLVGFGVFGGALYTESLRIDRQANEQNQRIAKEQKELDVALAKRMEKIEAEKRAKKAEEERLAKEKAEQEKQSQQTIATQSQTRQTTQSTSSNTTQSSTKTCMQRHSEHSEQFKAKLRALDNELASATAELDRLYNSGEYEAQGLTPEQARAEWQANRNEVMQIIESGKSVLSEQYRQEGAQFSECVAPLPAF